MYYLISNFLYLKTKGKENCSRLSEKNGKFAKNDLTIITEYKL